MLEACLKNLKFFVDHSDMLLQNKVFDQQIN